MTLQAAGIASAVASTGAAFLVQSTLLIAAALLLARLATRTAVVRAAIYQACFAALAVLPIVTVILCGGSPVLTQLPAGAWIVRVTAGWFWLFWPCGAGLLLGLLAVCHAKMRHRRRGASIYRHWGTLAGLHSLSESMGVPQPDLLVGEEEETPTLIGYVEPAIILPEAVDGCPADEHLLAVMLHEVAHAARHDTLVNLLSWAVASVFFFQPLVWVLRRRLCDVADEVADDIVLDDGANRDRYAEELCYWGARGSPSVWESVAGESVVRSKSTLRRRVERILDTARVVVARLSPAASAGIALTIGLAATMTALLASADREPVLLRWPPARLWALAPSLIVPREQGGTRPGPGGPAAARQPAAPAARRDPPPTVERPAAPLDDGASQGYEGKPPCLPELDWGITGRRAEEEAVRAAGPWGCRPLRGACVAALFVQSLNTGTFDHWAVDRAGELKRMVHSFQVEPPDGMGFPIHRWGGAGLVVRLRLHDVVTDTFTSASAVPVEEREPGGWFFAAVGRRVIYRAVQEHARRYRQANEETPQPPAQERPKAPSGLRWEDGHLVPAPLEPPPSWQPGEIPKPPRPKLPAPTPGAMRLPKPPEPPDPPVFPPGERGPDVRQPEPAAEPRAAGASLYEPLPAIGRLPWQAAPLGVRPRNSQVGPVGGDGAQAAPPDAVGELPWVGGTAGGDTR